jgi:hypothetical protein
MLTKQELDNKVVVKKISQLSNLDKDAISFFFSNGYALSSVLSSDTVTKILEINIASKMKSYFEHGVVHEAHGKEFYLRLNYFGLLVRKKLTEEKNSVIPPTYI